MNLQYFQTWEEKPGGTVPWTEKVESNTGEEITAKFIVDMINNR